MTPTIESNDASSHTPNEGGSHRQKCTLTDNKNEFRCVIAGKCVQDCEANERVCPCSANAAGKAASLAMIDMSDESNVFVSKPSFPDFPAESLVVGKLLGEGGFCKVHEVRTSWREEYGCGKGGSESETNEIQESHVKKQIYAMKCLRGSVMVNGYKFQCGAADLAIEARFLSALDHPHIVRLHGIAAGSVERNIAKGKESSFFIVIDRLYETLDDRLEKWRHETSEFDNLLYRTRHDYHGLKRRALLSTRLKVAIDIASTLQYLHGLNIIYRDLKPENIGFDSDGTVKIFDFGLAKELKVSAVNNKDGAGDTYNLTGLTGSRRYMAPEVECAVPYGLSADVYSFGVLLYEICSLEKPYSCIRYMSVKEEVMQMKRNLHADGNGSYSFWPSFLKSLIQQCWNDDARERPKFDEIMTTLAQSIDKYALQEEEGREHAKILAKAGMEKHRRVIAPTRGVESTNKPVEATRRRWVPRPRRRKSNGRI